MARYASLVGLAQHAPGHRSRRDQLISDSLAGTSHSGGRKQFWNVTGYERAIVITLSDGSPYDKVIVSVADPTGVVRTVNSAAGA